MVAKRKAKTKAKTSSRKKTVGKKIARKKTARKAAKKTVRKKAAKKVARKKSTRRGAGLNKITYAVSAELQAVVGSTRLTRPQIVKKLWDYIKAHKCQDAKNRRLIVPDAKLSEVIGKKPVDMMKLAGCLSKHIK